MVLGLGAVTSLDIISVGIDSDNCGVVDHDLVEQIRRQQMDSQKIKEIAFYLIEENQADLTINDTENKYLYILAYNDGVFALVRRIEEELRNEVTDGQGHE